MGIPSPAPANTGGTASEVRTGPAPAPTVMTASPAGEAASDPTTDLTTGAVAQAAAETVPATVAALNLTAPAAAPVASLRVATAAATANANAVTDLFAPIQAFIEGIGLLVRRTFFNDAPTVAPVQLTGLSSGPITGTIGAIDPEGDPITYSLSRDPQFGSVTIGPDGSYTYTPGVGFGGTDTFAVTATDTGFHINLLNPFRPAGTLATAVVTQGDIVPRLQFAFSYAGGALFWSNEARSALESAAALLAANFEVSAPVTITYTVTGQFNPLSGTLASATSDLISTGPGLLPTVVQNKIITGVDSNGAAADGEIDWNFGIGWALGNSVAGGEYDFQSVAIHELMHTFGFLSNIDQAGSNNGRSWTSFDGFVVDGDGTDAIGGDFRWNTAFNTNLTGGGGGLYFSGPAAVAAYGGLVPLYTPNPWEPGSSLSHLDDWTFVRPNEQLMNAFVEKGPGIRTLSEIEIGILTDLGYTMVPLGGSSAYLLLGLVMLRRRKIR